MQSRSEYGSMGLNLDNRVNRWDGEAVSNVLVTGAAGYIGLAVGQRLLRAGYRVYGLVRSDVDAEALRARGIAPVLGDLDDEAVLRSGVRNMHAVVDTASADHADATNAFLDALAGTGARYIRTSGTGVYTDLAHGGENPIVFTEETPHQPVDVVAKRYETDLAVAAATDLGLHPVVIRPSMIYGDGGSEQLPLLIRTAIRTNTSLYLGSGENRWGNVFLADVAEAYLLALENAPPGRIYNLASGENRIRDIAEAIATLTGAEARSCTPETAFSAFGRRWVEVALSSNSRVDSALARTELHWEPKGPSLLDELTRGSYRRLWSHKGDPHDHAINTDRRVTAQ